MNFCDLLDHAFPGRAASVPRCDDPTDLSLLADALAAVKWVAGVQVPSVAEVAAAIPSYEVWLAGDAERSLLAKKRTMLAVIDQQAEAERLKYVTPGEGQAMVYLQKQAEAERYVAAGLPTELAGYPLLAARSTATGTPAAAVAAEWSARAAAWSAIAAQIETVRETAKSAVGLATTPEDISAIVSGLVWPS